MLDVPGQSSDPLVIKVTHTNGFSLEIQVDTESGTLKPLLECGHYESEALDQFLPWVVTEKIQPLT